MFVDDEAEDVKLGEGRISGSGSGWAPMSSVSASEPMSSVSASELDLLLGEVWLAQPSTSLRSESGDASDRLPLLLVPLGR